MAVGHTLPGSSVLPGGCLPHCDNHSYPGCEQMLHPAAATAAASVAATAAVTSARIAPAACTQCLCSCGCQECPCNCVPCFEIMVLFLKEHEAGVICISTCSEGMKHASFRSVHFPSTDHNAHFPTSRWRCCTPCVACHARWR